MRRRSSRRPQLAVGLCLLSFALFAVAGSLQLLYYVLYAVAPPSGEGRQLLLQQYTQDTPPDTLQLALQQGELQTVYAQTEQQHSALQEDNSRTGSTDTPDVHLQYAKQASETVLASRQAAGEGAVNASVKLPLFQPSPTTKPEDQQQQQQQQQQHESPLGNAALICFCYNRYSSDGQPGLSTSNADYCAPAAPAAPPHTQAIHCHQ